MAQQWYNPNGMYPPYASLVSQTNKNYETAINYYTQRKLLFKEALSQGGLDVYQQYINALGEKAQIFNDIVLKKAMSAITSGSYTAQQKKDDGTYSVEIAQIFNSRLFNKNTGAARLNQFALGKQFEEFMSNNAVSTAQLQKVQKMINDNTNYLISQVGNVQQQAWSIGMKTDTRTDLAISANGKIGQMELVTALDLEATPPDGVNMTDYLIDAITAAGTDMNVFGFQLKTYKSDKDDKRWQNAQAVADRISELFDAANRRAWSSGYAVNYPTWYLSKYLINIINPVNVANITLNGIEFMDDWLRHIRLYMEVKWDKDTGDQVKNKFYGPGVWVVRPQVATKHILTRAINKGNQERTVFKGFGNYGGMRKAAYQKEIQVASIRNL